MTPNQILPLTDVAVVDSIWSCNAYVTHIHERPAKKEKESGFAPRNPTSDKSLLSIIRDIRNRATESPSNLLINPSRCQLVVNICTYVYDVRI